MLCLGSYLPLFIGDFLPENEDWLDFIWLLNIMDYILAHIYRRNCGLLGPSVSFGVHMPLSRQYCLIQDALLDSLAILILFRGNL